MRNEFYVENKRQDADRFVVADNAVNFGNTLRCLRERMNFTQKKLGELIGYSEKSVSKWERGDSEPSLATLVNLAQALGTDVNTLVGYSGAPSYFLGVDIGAVRSVFVLSDKNGKVLRSCDRDGANPVDVGLEYTKNVVDSGISEIIRGIPCGLVSAFVGVSGFDTGDPNGELELMLARYGFSKYCVAHSVESAIAVTLGKKDGICAIMGTGSIIYAVKNGERKRIGGYGYLLYDGGCFYDIGRSVIEEALMSYHSDIKTMLSSMCEKKLSGNVTDALGNIYRKGKSYISSFAHIAFSAYRLGDESAVRIIENNISLFTDKLRIALSYFDGGTEVNLIGGMCEYSDVILPIMERQLENTGVKINVCKYERYYGALLLAGLSMKGDDMYNTNIHTKEIKK
ncbi:MAG: helix-turn-helix domain-containing protein [Eubacteriales bacterium]|nr:helix-turn-helix domain-containing protein [Eubacteriales bacterium]